MILLSLSFVRTSLKSSWLLGQMLKYAPSSLVPAILGVLSTALFTRILSSADYGWYSLVVSTAGLASTLGTQWMTQSIARSLPLETEGTNRERLKKALALVIVVFAGITVVVSTVLLFVDQPELRWFEEFRIGGASALMAGGTGSWLLLLSVFQAELRAGAYTTYNLLQVVLRFALGLLLTTTILRNGNGLVLANVLATVLLLPFAWRTAALPSPKNVISLGSSLGPTVKALATYGVPMMGWALIASLLNIGDRYVIQHFWGNTEVGIYSASYTFVTGFGNLFGAPILLATHPFLMKAWGAGDKRTTATWLGLIFDWFCLASVSMVGLVWIFSEDLAQVVLGPEFREGHTIFPIVLAGIFVWQLAMYLHKPIEFTGKPLVMLGLGTVSLAVNIGLNLLFIPRFGYIAAAFTTLACFLLYAFTAGAFGKRLLDWPLSWTRLTYVMTIPSLTVVAAAIQREPLNARIGSTLAAVVTVLIAGVGPALLAVYLVGAHRRVLGFKGVNDIG